MPLTSRFQRFTKTVAIVCALLLAPGDAIFVLAQESPPPAPAPLAPNQLDSLVAPIALYPDPLLSQILVASTYPLELVEADQWLQRKPGLTGPALTQGAQQQNWDPSVQALIIFPDLVNRLTSGHHLDDQSRKRISGAAGRRDGRSPADAGESSAGRETAIDASTKGRPDH